MAVILGILMGVAFGLLAILSTKYLDMREPMYKYQEIGLLLILPFLCYWLCQYLNFMQHDIRISSPIAICVTGAIMGNVAWVNMSEASRFYYQVM